MSEKLTFTLDANDGKTGDVVITLRPDLAPKHVEQITTLAKDGFYDGLTFHRVIDGFMAQGGCPDGIVFGGVQVPRGVVGTGGRHRRNASNGHRSALPWRHAALGVYNHDVSHTKVRGNFLIDVKNSCLLYTSPSPRDLSTSRMPSSA